MEDSKYDSPPTRFGLILYPQFEVLDVFGPIECLNVITRPQFTLPLKNPLSLSIIASSLSPVPAMDYLYPRPQFEETFNPTHTFETAPEDLEVLIIPGGMGDGRDDAVEFVKNRFPSLRYLITICTGADVAARAGVLDGWKATTNKKAWKYVTSKPTSGKTYWIADARYVETANGKIWTTSGVSAGTDGMVAWIAKVYGEDIAVAMVNWMEYRRDTSTDDSGFAQIWDCQDVPPVSFHE